MFTSMSPNSGGWMKALLVSILMTGTGFGVNSNCLATAGEEPSPASGSCSFGTLGDFLVVGFFEALFLQLKMML
jgi:hypothetical protein